VLSGLGLDPAGLARTRARPRVRAKAAKNPISPRVDIGGLDFVEQIVYETRL
jgi:hypothetical protein